MSGKKIHQVAGIDTNIFIYYFQQHYQLGLLAKKFLQTVVLEKTKGITSIISLLELLSLKAPSESIEKLQTEYLGFPNLHMFDVTQPIAIEAARIRRAYGYRTADAIQLATALYAKATVFVTNDKRLQNFKELEVRLLSN